LHGPIRQRRLWERLFKRRFINGLTYLLTYLLTDGQTDRRTDRQNYDFQVRASIAASRGKNTDQLWLTNPRDALHHGERAANK